MQDCRECAATASDVRRCQARSAWRRRARFMPYGPKSAGPACPATSNAQWRGGGTDYRCWPDFACVPANTGIHTPCSIAVMIAADIFCDNPGRWLPPAFAGDDAQRVARWLRRRGLRHILVVEFVLDRREGAERFGRERDRLAAAIGR